MKIIDQTHEILTDIDHHKILGNIERAGRTCYQSADKITPDSSEAFAKKLLTMGHHSVIEHESVSVKFITDRGITHELVRHRLCSFSQESSRYVKYDNIEFIRPVWWRNWSEAEQNIWMHAMIGAEANYRDLIRVGSRPEQARAVLPNSTKTEIVMTANLREWRHVLDLRCSKKAHPQMRMLMLGLLDDLNYGIPVIFEDLYDKYFL